MSEPHARIDSLDAIEAALWHEIERAAREPGHAWRTAVLATVDGTAADARTVVLREADAAQKQLLIYTDTRAPKVAQLMSHPIGTLLMWSAALSWQVRCRVRLSVEGSGLAVASRWAKVQHSRSAADYLAPLAPGATLHAEAPTAARREHFGVITAEVVQIDWLELHAQGHRRAVFEPQGARWVQP
jgi:pyridoxamine 5'-phosphate oxidase